MAVRVVGIGWNFNSFAFITGTSSGNTDYWMTIFLSGGLEQLRLKMSA